MYVSYGNIKLSANTISDMDIRFDYEDDYFLSKGQLILKDKLLRGELIGMRQEKEILRCKLSGVIKKDIYTTEGNFSFGEHGETYLMQGKLDIDMRNNQNSFLFELHIKMDDIQMLDMKLQNTSTRKTIPNLNIQNPGKSIELESLMEQISSLNIIY